MAIRGSLSEASLADVLQLLALGQKTGCLSVAREGSFGTVHFAGGRIVHAALVNRRDRLGDRLIRLGVLAPDDLARVNAAGAIHDDRDLARVLLAQAMVPRDVLVREYRTQVEEAVYQLFAWSQGTFTFEPEAEDATEAPLLSVGADSLLLEGARRVDEWTQIEKKVSSLDLIFELDSARLAQREGPLSATQERILSLLDGTHDLLTVIERSGLGEFDVGKAVYGLVTAGYVHRVGRSAARRQPSPESRVAEHRNLGVAFYRTGMLDEAQREFRRVLELRDADGVSRFHLGLVQLQRRDWDGAVETFRRAAQEPDAPAAVFHNLAYAYEQLGDLAAAAAHLDDAARRLTLPDPRLALSRATIALRRGDPAGAEEALAEARRAWGPRQPSAAWFHVAGLAAACRGELARAAAVLEEGLSWHPHAAVLLNNLAVVHERRGSAELAARTLEHALLEDANGAHLHKNLGDYLYRAQRYDDALEAFERVVRLAPSHGPDVYLKIGNIHYRRGALEAARAAWDAALVLDPDHRIVRANLAVIPPVAVPSAARSAGHAAVLGEAA
ncbi:MAG: tetratricopeptide repeat protein [Gemmatimonadota bacterium]|nr:tetratricopeptide repeat protein [Gemmatimonadota bacterium]MDQ8166752.1 tetratricopeptide repeat protein [Gemmatimonadota bacterium]MDQ8171603.1 tetratricopeptide repeat protein [Gemmatimonadota bacterium]